MFNEALAMNAFADHYLTDLFAAGHLRVPRRALKDMVKTGDTGAAAIAKYQHDEDNAWGLFVRNGRGDRWQSLGDAHLMTPAGQRNGDIASAAVQKSMEEVFAAFDQGLVAQSSAYGALDFTPDLALAGRVEDGRDGTYLNYLAQFNIIGSEIHHRKPMEDINARSHALLNTSKVHDWNWDHQETPDGYTMDQVYNAITGHKPALYGPPSSALPRPGKPSLEEPGRRSDPTALTGPSQVRYCVVLVGQQHYPDGKVAEFLSQPSDWTGWFERDADRYPIITLPGDPQSPGRARAIAQQIIRQREGKLPEHAGRTGPQPGSFGDTLV